MAIAMTMDAPMYRGKASLSRRQRRHEDPARLKHKQFARRAQHENKVGQRVERARQERVGPSAGCGGPEFSGGSDGRVGRGRRRGGGKGDGCLGQGLLAFDTEARVDVVLPKGEYRRLNGDKPHVFFQREHLQRGRKKKRERMQECEKQRTKPEKKKYTRTPEKMLLKKDPKKGYTRTPR